jgi:hypothetical protein
VQLHDKLKHGSSFIMRVSPASDNCLAAGMRGEQT